MSNNLLFSFITILASVGSALTGILVSRRLSLRQIENSEAGMVITNADYWRKEVETFQNQIKQLREELARAGVKIEEQQKELESVIFRYYQEHIENEKLRRIVEGRYREDFPEDEEREPRGGRKRKRHAEEYTDYTSTNSEIGNDIGNNTDE